MNEAGKNRKLGLALGGGATLGMAHIGVLKAIEEMEIDIDCISGTSIGAYIAALYAFGTSTREIEEEVRSLDWLDISTFSFTKLKFGLLTNDKLGDSLEGRLSSARIADAELPLAIVATDIANGKKVILTDCAVSQAVMASTAVPGLYAPVDIGEQMLVDGGLVENVPVSALNELRAGITVGVDLSKHRSYQQPADFVDVLVNSIDIAIDNATRIQTSSADLLVAPRLRAYSRTDPGQASDLIDEGYQAALSAFGDSDLFST